MDNDLLEFTQRLIHFRKAHPVFMKRTWFIGRDMYGRGLKDIVWFKSDGHAMEEATWGMDHNTCLGIILNGEAIPNPSPRGDPVIDDSFLILFNVAAEPATFTLPPCEKEEERWLEILDTGAGWIRKNEEIVTCKKEVVLNARSMMLFIKKRA